MWGFDLGALTLIFLTGSVLGLVLSGLISKPKVLRQQGYIELNNVREESFEVMYPIPYARPPHLYVMKIGKENRWSFEVLEQTAAGFRIRASSKNAIGGDRDIHWDARGSASENADLRSPWAKLSISERLFGLSSVIGALAAVWEFGDRVLKLFN